MSFWRLSYYPPCTFANLFIFRPLIFLPCLPLFQELSEKAENTTVVFLKVDVDDAQVGNLLLSCTFPLFQCRRRWKLDLFSTLCLYLDLNLQ